MNLLNIIPIILFSVMCETLEVNDKSQHYGNNSRDKLEFNENNTNKVSATEDYPKNKVQIKVYYESLCPGSIDFFKNQLRPAVQALAPFLDIHLVPYGNAKTREVSGHFYFKCQHGPEECFVNRLHACAVDVLRNESQAVIFNACLMQYSKFRRLPKFDYRIVVSWCNYTLQLRTQGIWECVNGDRSSALLKAYGEETRALRISYVPYVVLGSSTDGPDDAGGDLMSTICHKLSPAPPPCDKWIRT
ncbi:gamma-interferon-inducible lysosomal thiol reductase-like [Ostrinia furnacalis]|uniref:gamma-interferon-inducible lysosomal thiol reductase-like n=1 Tax=Ostrinia furnacalis TaxID=93504 RepID=UPI00103BFD5C|nr:gamma-interferon-inducible lysosomal thiol reductase-like [Ostrinia furnacalis]